MLSRGLRLSHLRPVAVVPHPPHSVLCCFALPMTRRTRAREIALQVLYQDDLNPGSNPAIADNFLRQRLKDEELVEFAHSLVSGVRRNRAELDEMLVQTADNWSIERM